jgi:transposase
MRCYGATRRVTGAAGKFTSRRDQMNSVIGLDISKEKSHGQAFLDRGKPFKGTFQFEHTREGLSKLLQVIQDVEHVSGLRPTFILEATGHYQSPVVQFLEEHHYLYIVINPLISNRLRKCNLRKVKTDASDAYLLGELHYKEEFEPFKKRGRSENWINERVQRLLDAAKQNPFQQTLYSSHLINLKILITLILQYQGHLAELEQNIDAMTQEIEEYELIQSIPGIGHSCNNFIGNWRSRPI